jgi:H+/Cl- antiporter ClcA
MGIYDWFAGLATIGGFAYFMAGFGVSYAWWWWRCKMHHERVRVPWHLVGIAIGTMAIIIVTFQSSAAYNTAQKTAQDSKD